MAGLGGRAAGLPRGWAPGWGLGAGGERGSFFCCRNVPWRTCPLLPLRCVFNGCAFAEVQSAY